MVSRLSSLPLYWRVFATNAAVLVLAFLGLVFAPVTVSVPPAFTELVVLGVGLLYPLADSYTAYLIGLPVVGFGVYSLFSGNSVYFPELFGPAVRASAIAVTNSIGRLATAAGPLLAGILTDVTGSYRIGFTVLAVLAGAGMLFFALASPPAPPARDPTGAPGPSAVTDVPHPA